MHDATKRCRCCQQIRPLDEFRRIRRDSEERHAECRSCWNECQRRYRRSRKSKKVATLAAELASLKRCDATVSALAVEVVKRYGDAHAVARDWCRQYAQAVKAGHCRIAQKFLLATVRLVAIENAIRQKGHDELRITSDEDLSRLFANSIRRAAVDDPQLVSEILKKLGWRVEPPQNH